MTSGGEEQAVDPAVRGLVDHLFRHSYGRMVAGLTRVFGPTHLELVEDVVQEALVRALRTWPFHGVPENPSAWLVQVAKNLALDALRRNALARKKEEEITRWADDEVRRESSGAHAADDAIEDDSLRLVFTCCHPALAFESRVVLTLKTLCGFGTAEIARAFLTKEATIAQRLVRAKRRIEEEAIPFEVPSASELASRLDAVLEVVYLLFNEGYAAHQGQDLVRADLVDEALRLAELLAEHPATRSPRVDALLALLCFQGARIRSRTDDVGDLLTLARQDRKLWDARRLALGWRHFERAIDGDELSAYHVEAAIAACHAAAPSYAETDWATILSRYDQLAHLADSPVVALNRAVAIAKVRGVEAGLAELDELDAHPALAEYYLLPATRALLLWTAGRCAEAEVSFQRALRCTCTEPERKFLERRLERCSRGLACEDF